MAKKPVLDELQGNLKIFDWTKSTGPHYKHTAHTRSVSRSAAVNNESAMAAIAAKSFLDILDAESLAKSRCFTRHFPVDANIFLCPTHGSVFSWTLFLM